MMDAFVYREMRRVKGKREMTFFELTFDTNGDYFFDMRRSLDVLLWWGYHSFSHRLGV